MSWGYYGLNACISLHVDALTPSGMVFGGGGPMMAAGPLEVTRFCIGKHAVSSLSPPEFVADITNQSFPPSPGVSWEAILAECSIQALQSIRILCETP